MTSKQCNSCKYRHQWRKKNHEDTCFLCNTHYFMKSKSCPCYEYGDFEEIRKEYWEKFGRELPQMVKRFIVDNYKVKDTSID